MNQRPTARSVLKERERERENKLGMYKGNMLRLYSFVQEIATGDHSWAFISASLRLIKHATVQKMDTPPTYEVGSCR